jgi:hypothetical protein
MIFLSLLLTTVKKEMKFVWRRAHNCGQIKLVNEMPDISMAIQILTNNKSPALNYLYSNKTIIIVGLLN